MRACYADRPQKLLSGIYFQLIWQHPLLLCSILSNIDRLSFVLKKITRKWSRIKQDKFFSSMPGVSLVLMYTRFYWSRSFHGKLLEIRT